MRKSKLLIGMLCLTFVWLQMNMIAGGEGIDYMPPDADVYGEEELKEYYKDDTRVKNVDTDTSMGLRAEALYVSSNLTGNYNSGEAEKVLLIPVAFSDVDFSNTHDMTHFQGLADELTNYYEVNSGYQEGVSGMTLECLVTEPVYSDYAMAEYGEDDQESGAIDEGNGSVSRLVVEAVEKLYQTGFDLSEFDKNGDKVVDHVIIIHAGMGQEQYPDTDLIWSHQYVVNETMNIGNMDVNSYTMVPETGQLGVFAHEFGHDLGLPDLYDTNGWTDGYTYGIGDWGLMGSGSWNHLPGQASGSMPSNLSAWSRVFLGWAEVTTITNDRMDMEIQNTGMSSVAKIYPKTNVGSNEFYLVEYRRQTGFDAGLPGEGALVWHIDQDMIDASIGYNQVNSNEARLGIELEQADGKWDMWMLLNQGDASDTFGNDGNNHHFAFMPYYLNVSNALRTYSDVDLLNFDVSGDFCTFDIYVDAKINMNQPVLVGPSDGEMVATLTPILYWDPLEHATRYLVQLSETSSFGDDDIIKTYGVDSDDMIYDGKTIGFKLPSYYAITDGMTLYWRVCGINPELSSFNFSQGNELTINTIMDFEVLDFDPMDIIQDPSHDNIFYMTDRDNKQVLKYDIKTGETRSLDFEYYPEFMYIRNQILYVTLPNRDHGSTWWSNDQYGSIGMIDLENFEISNVADIDTDPYNLVVTSDGYLVVSSGSGQHTEMVSYDPVTFERLSYKRAYMKTVLRYNELLNQVYTVTQGLSPTDMNMYAIDENGILDYIHDSPYHGDYRMNSYFDFSPDGTLIFNYAGNIFTSTDEVGTDLRYYDNIPAYTDIFFDTDMNLFYTIRLGYVKEYDYDSLELVDEYWIGDADQRIYKVGDDFYGIDDGFKTGKTIINKLELDNSTEPVSFSLDGDNKNRLMGAKPGMLYTIGDSNQATSIVQSDNMILSEEEMALLASEKEIYIFLNGIKSFSNENIVHIQLEERDHDSDAEFFSNLFWNESNNQFYGFDERFEYMYEGNDTWKTYSPEGMEFSEHGLAVVRFGARGLTLPGYGHLVSLVDDSSYMNGLAWNSESKKITWIDESSGYLVTNEGEVYYLNLTTGEIRHIHIGEKVVDILYHEGRLFGMIYRDNLWLTYLYEIDLNGGLSAPIHITGHDMHFNGSLEGNVVFQEDDPGLVYEYELESQEKVLSKLYEILTDGREEIIITENQKVFTSYGNVYSLNTETAEYELVGFIDANPMDVEYDMNLDAYIAYYATDGIRLYNSNMELIDSIGFEKKILGGRRWAKGFNMVFQDMDIYRTGQIVDYAEPEVSLSFSGDKSNQLIGSTSLMEMSIDGESFYRVPYNDYEVNANLLDADKDIQIRYRDDSFAIETGTVVIDLEPGLIVTDIVADDEENTLVGLTENMEYSLDGGRTWLVGSVELPDLTGNISILVRMRGEELRLPGPIESYIFSKPVVIIPPNPGGGVGGGVPFIPPTVEEIPEEEIPEESDELITEEIILGFGLEEMDDYIDMELYDVATISFTSEEQISTERSLNRQYLKDTSSRVYVFEIEGWIGDIKTAVHELEQETEISIQIDMSEYSPEDLERTGVYQLIDGEWIYVGGHIQEDGLVVFKTSKTGIFAVLTGTRTFEDTMGHWARNYIEVMAAKQITNGKGDNLFDPESNITRAEYVALIVRSLGLKSDHPSKNIYEDVTEGKWYYDVIQTAGQANLISENVSFDPEKDILREDMMVIIVEALKASLDTFSISQEEVDNILKEYKDSGSIKGVNREAVALAIKYGIITGRTSDYLAIQETASRAETMVVIMRLLNLINSGLEE